MNAYSDVDPGEKSRRVLAWTLSLGLNGLLVVWFWLHPELLRQTQTIDRETSQQNVAEQDAARERIQATRQERKNDLPISEQTKERILERLDQEKTHRTMTRVQELKAVYDNLAEHRDRRLEALREEAEKRPVTQAADELRAATADLAEKQTELANRLEGVADRQEKPEQFKELAEQAQLASKDAAQQADRIGDPPSSEHLKAATESAAKNAILAEEVQKVAADNITKARSLAVITAAERVEKAVEIAAQAEKSVVDYPIPEKPQLSENTRQVADSGQAENMEQAYAAAMELERAIVKLYDQTRAAELAQKSGTDLQTTTDRMIPTSSPERPNPFGGAQGETAPTMAERTSAMAAAERQVAEAAQVAAQRMALVEGRAEQAETGTREFPAKTLLANQQLRAAAFDGRRFSDVAGLMQSAEGGQDGDRGDKEYDSDSALRADAPPVRRNTRLPVLAGAQALPGRRFSSASKRKGWLYLDTWYVIGPWANQNITSFEPVYPPEERIDLDASYPGAVYTEGQATTDKRRGVDLGHRVGSPRQLRWRFTQSDGARVVVPDERQNSTYYAYTDVYFEEAQEMLVAVGTDDSGRVWINGLPVGQDSGLTPWAIDETLRKVWFKQGYNEILVRLENGPKDAELSFLICPVEALSQPHTSLGNR